MCQVETCNVGFTVSCCRRRNRQQICTNPYETNISCPNIPCDSADICTPTSNNQRVNNRVSPSHVMSHANLVSLYPKIVWRGLPCPVRYCLQHALANSVFRPKRCEVRRICISNNYVQAQTMYSFVLIKCLQTWISSCSRCPPGYVNKDSLYTGNRLHYAKSSFCECAKLSRIFRCVSRNWIVCHVM